MQHCLRQLWFTASMFDFELIPHHIPGAHNILADSLSRWHADASHHALFYTSASSLGRQYTFRDVPWDCFDFQVT